MDVNELKQELEDSRQLWTKLKEENDRLAPFAKAAAEKSVETGETQRPLAKHPPTPTENVTGPTAAPAAAPSKFEGMTSAFKNFSEKNLGLVNWEKQATELKNTLEETEALLKEKATRTSIFIGAHDGFE